MLNATTADDADAVAFEETPPPERDEKVAPAHEALSSGSDEATRFPGSA